MQYKGTDECRQACGGVGYHIASGVVTIFTDYSVMPTYEGINVLMLQQSSRYLLKQVKKAKGGKKCKNNFSYINELKQLTASKLSAKTVQDILNLDVVDELLKVRAAYHLDTTSNDLEQSKAPSLAKQNDIFANDIQKMTKYHILYIMFQLARKEIESNSF